MDMMLHNDKNTPPSPVLQAPVIAVGDDADAEPNKITEIKIKE
jgi:hypothetical protein